ncbi:MAG TPA: radical SAM protein [Clostridia bacterium]
MGMNLTSQPLVYLIAFQEQDNLGIGYIASVLLENDIRVKLVDFRVDYETILENIKRDEPQIIGLSIIFQYHLEEFKKLVEYLKSNGVKSFFTAGGHYPSLKYEELMNYIPDLDSIILFEGEHTFLELVNALKNNESVSDIKGLVLKTKDGIKVNSLRELEENIDEFPLPVRQSLKEYALKRNYATIIAGRGCLYNCSFCSIREFYKAPPGSLKRIRKPDMVVREMELLHKEKGADIFIFQDDDFPIGKSSNRKWILEFCEELKKKNLYGKILWKISIRVDEADRDILKILKDAGLFLVYLGIESGTDKGLVSMNKHTTVEANKIAVNILKELGINYDFGFMLLDPYSTEKSINDNFDFLESICADGSAPVSFCKMIPYAKTPVEEKLIQEGRLIGPIYRRDYKFLDERLDFYYLFIVELFYSWFFMREGFLGVIRSLRYCCDIYERFYEPLGNEFKEEVRTLVMCGNKYFIGLGRKILSQLYTEGIEKTWEFVTSIKNEVIKKHEDYVIKGKELTAVIENKVR